MESKLKSGHISILKGILGHIRENKNEEFSLVDETSEAKLKSGHISTLKGILGHIRQNKNNDFSLVDETMDSQLTPDQISTLRESFTMFDKDSSGTLNMEELMDLCMSFIADLTESDLEKGIQNFDSNNDGQIDYDEFMDFMDMKMQAPLSDSELLEVFNVYDGDNDGFITPLEIIESMQKLGCELTDKEVEEMMKIADKNGDNQIDFEEFKILMMR